jgi:hypothetical protein
MCSFESLTGPIYGCMACMYGTVPHREVRFGSVVVVLVLDSGYAVCFSEAFSVRSLYGVMVGVDGRSL